MSDDAKHVCGSVWIDGDGVVHHEGATFVDTCADGCCSDYKCDSCGKVFRIEWPD